MTRRRATALATALLAALAAAPALADSPERLRPPPPAARSPPAGSKRIELHITFPPWRYTGTFRALSEAGLVLDEGIVRDQGGFSAGDGTVRRVLEGARGTLVLRVESGAKPAGFPSAFGRWSIVSGTGAWASLAGGGTFTSCGGGAPKGVSPFEMQTLLGHILRR
jgi:hypothetical protein